MADHPPDPGSARPTDAGAPGDSPDAGQPATPDPAETDAAGIARAEELAEVLAVARESGDGSLLMRTLARAAVVVPLPPELAGSRRGRRDLEPGTELPLPIIENDGIRYVVAFTSEERMAAWFGDAEAQAVWHEALLPDLLAGWPADAGLALDASSEGGVLLPHPVVERVQLLAGGTPIEEAYDLGPATRFRAGTPVEPPEDVVAALRTAAQRHPGIRRVTMLLVQIDEPGGRTWPVVGVLFDEGVDAEGPLTEMVSAVESVTEEHVSFTALPAAEGSEFEQVLRDEAYVIL